MSAMLPAHLTETINNLGDAARILAEESTADREQRAAEREADRRHQSRQARRHTLMLVIIGVLVASVLGLSVYNRVLGNQNASIIKTIESCTAQDGACARESQARTEVAVTRLLRMEIEIVACDRAADTDADYRACVDRALARILNPPTTPAPTTQPGG